MFVSQLKIFCLVLVGHLGDDCGQHYTFMRAQDGRQQSGLLLAAFPEWRGVMDGWGERMLATVSTVAEVVAVGLGLERDAFTSRMQMGPHLLAPTGIQKSCLLRTEIAVSVPFRVAGV